MCIPWQTRNYTKPSSHPLHLHASGMIPHFCGLRAQHRAGATGLWEGSIKSFGTRFGGYLASAGDNSTDAHTRSVVSNHHVRDIYERRGGSERVSFARASSTIMQRQERKRSPLPRALPLPSRPNNAGQGKTIKDLQPNQASPSPLHHTTSLPSAATSLFDENRLAFSVCPEFVYTIVRTPIMGDRPRRNAPEPSPAQGLSDSPP